MAKSKHRHKIFNRKKAKRMTDIAEAGAAKITGAVRHKMLQEDAAANTGVDDRQRGLYSKFEVRRIDGSSAPGGKHAGCDIFVLDVNHDSHAAPALLSYAMSARADGYGKLADDVLAKIQPYVQQLNAQAATGSVELLTDIENSTDEALHKAATEMYLDMQAGTYESELVKELLARFIVVKTESRPEEPAPKVKRSKKTESIAEFDKNFIKDEAAIQIKANKKVIKKVATTIKKKLNETATDSAAEKAA